MRIPPLRQDPFVQQSAWICLIGFGGFMLWAGLVSLDEGVSATGRIIVQNDRQTIQHLEGGIIDNLHVSEGDIVAAGDVLVTLHDTESLSSRDQLLKRIAAFEARVASLEALSSGAEHPDFSSLDILNLSSSDRDEIEQRERDLFDQQREVRSAEIAVLETRRQSALQTARSRARQARSIGDAHQGAEEELSLLNTLLDQQMVRRDQVTSLERELAGLESELARFEGEADEAQSRAEDLSAQIREVTAQSRRRIAEELRDARVELLAAHEALNPAQDVLDRSVINAPVAGEVLNLHFSSGGGVVAPGEAIMEIVPSLPAVLASVRIRPTDRSSVFEGQVVSTQISAYRSWRTPRIEGVVEAVSADLKTDSTTGASYYEVRISLAAPDADADIELLPGMPVETFIFSGHRRTTLDYLFEPIRRSLFTGLRAG